MADATRLEIGSSLKLPLGARLANPNSPRFCLAGRKGRAVITSTAFLTGRAITTSLLVISARVEELIAADATIISGALGGLGTSGAGVLKAAKRNWTFGLARGSGTAARNIGCTAATATGLVRGIGTKRASCMAAVCVFCGFGFLDGFREANCT